MTARLAAILALLALAAFLGVLAWRVPHPDLIVVLAVGFCLAAYDLLTTTWRPGSRNGKN